MKASEKLCGRCIYMVTVIDGGEIVGEGSGEMVARLSLRRECRHPENSGSIVSYDYSCRGFVNVNDVFSEYTFADEGLRISYASARRTDRAVERAKSREDHA